MFVILFLSQCYSLFTFIVNEIISIWYDLNKTQINKERYLNKSTISSNTMLNWKHCFQNRRLNLTFSLKNVHYLGTTNTLLLANSFSHHRSQRFITRCIKAQQGFYNVLIQTTFTLSSNFKAFLFTDVDDFDMMHYSCRNE